jgi:hypothetical protein
VVLTSPKDSVPKIVSLARWQRNWVNDHRSINFSGLVQEMLCEIIKTSDPEYYEKNKKYLDIRITRKKEIIGKVISEIQNS